jgi:hypothetical protein
VFLRFYFSNFTVTKTENPGDGVDGSQTGNIMAKLTKQTLYSFFETGDKPTQAQFAALIASMLNLIDDKALLGLRPYDNNRTYLPNDSVIYNNAIYQALVSTAGTFDPAAWKKIAGTVSGSPVYKGTWNAEDNTPDLLATTVAAGDYYIVSVAGNTDLSGITDWSPGDWAIYNGSAWGKVDNTDAVTDAENVGGDGLGVFKQKSGTILRFKKVRASDGSLYVAVDPDENYIDLGIKFDDGGVRPDRPWSAQKISTEFLKKVNRPAVANLLNFALFDSDGNIFDNNVNGSHFMPSTARAINIPVDANKGHVSENVQQSLDDIDNALVVLEDAVDDHITDLSNPHKVKKGQVGLGKVTNDQQMSLKFTAAMEKEVVTDSKPKTALTLVFKPEEKASYFIEWYYEIGRTGSQAISASVTVSLDGSRIGESNPRLANNSGSMSFSGFILRELLVAEHKINIDFSRTDGTTSNAMISRVRVRVIKS